MIEQKNHQTFCSCKIKTENRRIFMILFNYLMTEPNNLTENKDIQPFKFLQQRVDVFCTELTSCDFVN